MSEQTQEQATQQAPAVDLTVQDLNALKTIIDVASQRGAFKPNEMTVVGTTYTKLENFLAAIAASQQAKEEATAEATDEAAGAAIDAAAV
jgi:hypothetical protein|tara:strand:- start:1463 stop:1732 length:270 start_codon:yes stop_codon:yes gene_type:complete